MSTRKPTRREQARANWLQRKKREFVADDLEVLDRLPPPTPEQRALWCELSGFVPVVPLGVHPLSDLLDSLGPEPPEEDPSCPT